MSSPEEQKTEVFYAKYPFHGYDVEVTMRIRSDGVDGKACADTMFVAELAQFMHAQSVGMSVITIRGECFRRQHHD